MKTDALVALLAADLRPVRPVWQVLLVALLPALAVGLVLLWVTLGFRADLAASLAVPRSVLRLVLTGALGVVGVLLALAIARPDRGAGGRLWPLVLVAGVALGAFLWAYAITPADGRQMAVMGKTMWTCLISIPLLSILPVTAFFAALRRGAPRSPALAGFAAGVGGSGLAAMTYALHCTEDSPLFYVTWYGLAILGVTMAATIIGARLLRW